MDFERREDKSGNRWYKPENEDNYYPSVTTVKNIIANEGLQNWFKHSSAQEIEEKTQHGCDVGDIVHESIEELIQSGETTIEDIEDNKIRKDCSKYLQGFINFWDAHDVSVKEMEVSVLNSKFGIAGTIDVVGSLDGEPAIIDWKTSNSKDNIGWQHQLTSYATSDPFRDADFWPKLYIARLKKRTKKGWQLLEYDYDRELVKMITDLWKRKHGTEPNFADEPETEFELE